MTAYSDAFHRLVFRMDYPEIPASLRGPCRSRLYSLDQFWSDHHFTPDLFQRVLAGCLHGSYTEPNLMLTCVFHPLVSPQELLAIITQWVHGQAERCLPPNRLRGWTGSRRCAPLGPINIANRSMPVSVA